MDYFIECNIEYNIECAIADNIEDNIEGNIEYRTSMEIWRINKYGTSFRL